LTAGFFDLPPPTAVPDGDKGVGDDSLDYVQADYDDDAPAPSPAKPRATPRRAPLTIEGELVAKSTGAAVGLLSATGCFTRSSQRPTSTVVDVNKHTIAFEP
jgi:hypothetical protein